MKYILASASPRRKELLALLVKDFEIIESGIDENLRIKDPRRLCMRLSYEKAADVAGRQTSGAVVIAADTIVVLGKEIMGKPRDEKEAFEMLAALSGQTHFVYTGVTVIDTSCSETVTEYEKTAVTFGQMSPQEILDYIKTGEPMDKAGAYGIQGHACRYIKKVNGCYLNVVGLPLHHLDRMLKKMGAL